jgi:hypothetical protein
MPPAPKSLDATHATPREAGQAAVTIEQAGVILLIACLVLIGFAFPYL